MSKFIEIKSKKSESKETTVSIVVDKDGVYEETYFYRELKNYDEDYFIDHLVYDATVNNDYVLERSENGSILLVDKKNGKDALWIHPKTKEFELFKYKKLKK